MSQTVAHNAPVDLNLLPLFVAVAEAASFSAAAEKLGVRRSSVSRSVAALERALGVQLFSRTTRSVALTTAGTALYAKVAPQLGGLRESLSSLPEREEEPSGQLRISAPADFGAVVLAPMVAAFAARYPRVQVDVRLSNRVADLVAEGFDLALRLTGTGRLKDSSLVARRLSELELQLFASPAYLARTGAIRSLGELAEHDWVWHRDQPLPRPLPKPKRAPHVSCDDPNFAWKLARAGAGVTLLPPYLVREDVAAGALVRVLPRFSLRSGAVYLVHPPARHVPKKVSAFTAFLVEALARQPLVSR